MVLETTSALAGATVLGSVIDYNLNKRSQKKANQRADVYNRKNHIYKTVNDARKSGISPLVALGGSANYSPATAVGQLHNDGQNLSRAVQQGLSSNKRTEYDALVLENQKLQNKLLEGQVTSQNIANSSQIAPSVENQSTLGGTSFILPKSNQVVSGVTPTTTHGAKYLDLNEDVYGEGGALILGGVNLGAEALRRLNKHSRTQSKKPKYIRRSER